MLSPTVDPTQLGFEDTSELEPLTDIIGQERAVEALEFGLSMKSPGYNLYVSGPVGTGKATLVRQMVTRLAQATQAPSDWCYVNNFNDAYHPKAIRLGPGNGPVFARDMEEFVKVARVELPRAFESENYEKRKNEITEVVQRRREGLLAELQREAGDLGFSIEATPVGIASVPLTGDGRPYTRDEYDNLPDDRKQEVKQRGARLQESTNQFVSRSRALEKEAQDKLRELDREIALFASIGTTVAEPYRVASVDVMVSDGNLTLEAGQMDEYTMLNWLSIVPKD